MLIGYARVSTADQTLALQHDALTKAGCERLFTDTASGWLAERPGLEEAFTYTRPGDTLVVWRLDRLGRSRRHLLDTVSLLQEQGIRFKSLQEQIDTTTSGTKLVFHVFALDEFERDLIRERTQAGLMAARTRGRLGGRPKALDPRKSMSDVARRLWQVRAAARVRKPQPWVMRPVAHIAISRDTVLVDFDDLITVIADAKKTAELLRAARSALRRVDALAAQALAQEDDVAADLAAVRTGLEQVVTRLAWRQSGEQRRARTGLRSG